MDILQFNDIHSIDIFCIVETWNATGKSPVINQHFINITNTIEGYVERTGAGRRSQGGILCFCHPDLKHEITVIYTDPSNNFVVFRVRDIMVAAAYFPPSASDHLVTEFFTKVLELAENQPCILMGDFNARMHYKTNDTRMNIRGRIVAQYLDESPLHLWNSEVGRFTTLNTSSGGRGVTDLVFSHNLAVFNVEIHETQSLGGSDHRPVTFDVPSNSNRTRQFERLNVRKLSEPEISTAYLDKLKETKSDIAARLSECTTSNEKWCTVKAFIEESALATCGKLRYKSFAKRNFWTRQLLDIKSKIQELDDLLQRTLQDVVGRRVFSIQRTALLHQYAEMIHDRKKKLFQDVANNLGIPSNLPALQKMVKCLQGRTKRTGCKLDPDKIETHAQHFLNTFGGPPEGTSAYLAPATIFFSGLITETQVLEQLKYLKLGKAAGHDGLMAEFLVFGQDVLAPLLANLFTTIAQSGRIPDEWCQALIVPVFKKGDDQNAANYRPIALTVITRRLYERILLKYLAPFIEKLANTQGGFRKFRSTLDQCYVLEEIIQANPEGKHCFMDLRAAFDTVNRQKLWNLLIDTYHVPPWLVNLLRALFDNNSSILVINGQRSSPIANTRGLLQGSSLSPILFNFYINPLLTALSQHDPSKLSVGPYRSNNLAFADDIGLHARSTSLLQELLRICEAWSLDSGMQFQPLKCVALEDSNQPQDPPLEIYGTPLATSEEVSYLGIPFSTSGILFEKNFLARSEKARSTAAALNRMGMNLTGFPQSASALLYKSFIRPIFEYGLALKIKQRQTLTALARTQSFALRLIFSAQRNTSANALQKLLLIEPIETRNLVLNMKFAARLHNSNDNRIPAVVVWRNAFADDTSRSTTWFVRNKNPLKPLATLLPIFGRRLTPALSIPTKAFEPAIQRRIVHDSIAKLNVNESSVSGTIECIPAEGYRHCLRPYAFTSDQIRVPVLRWIVGNVAIHMPCINEGCSTTISRRHAAICSGAHDALVTRYPQQANAYQQLLQSDPSLRSTLLDYLLNQHRINPPATLYPDIASSVSMIYEKCLGYRQKANGFFVPAADIPDLVDTYSISPPLQREPTPPRRPG